MTKCLKCKKNTSNPKFCSLSCSTSYANTQNPKIPKTKKCIICDKLMTHRNKKYCSHKCYSIARKQEYELNITQTGKLCNNSKIYKATLAMKQYMLDVFGNYCSICNQKPFWNNKSLILILDHINGISNDWRIENIRMICSNCDSQLPTYKNKNKNKGRPR